MKKFLSKLFSRKRDVKVETTEEQVVEIADECNQYIRGDLVIFVMKMDEPTLRYERDYCLIGYLNSKQTKFKDIATGKVYDLDRGFYHCRSIEPTKNNRRYTEVERKKQGENFYWVARFAGEYKPFYVRVNYSLHPQDQFLKLFETYYANKNDDEIIDKSTIVLMKQDLNGYIERQIRSELHKRSLAKEKERQEQAVKQQKANEIAKVRKGYSKDF